MKIFSLFKPFVAYWALIGVCVEAFFINNAYAVDPTQGPLQNDPSLCAYGYNPNCGQATRQNKGSSWNDMASGEKAYFAMWVKRGSNLVYVTTIGANGNRQATAAGLAQGYCFHYYPNTLLDDCQIAMSHVGDPWHFAVASTEPRNSAAPAHIVGDIDLNIAKAKALEGCRKIVSEINTKQRSKWKPKDCVITQIAGTTVDISEWY